MNSPMPTPPMPRPGHEPIGAVSLSLILLTVMLWGGTPVAIKYSVDLLPPFAVSGARFVLAALFMLVWCRWEGSRLRLHAGQFEPVFWCGVLLFLQIGCFTLGVAESNASHGTVFINTFIFWVAAIEHWITHTDRLTLRKMTGLVVAAAAVVLIVATTGQPTKRIAGVAESGRPASERSLRGEAPPNDVSGQSLEPHPAGLRPTADAATLWGDILLLMSGGFLGIKVVYTKHALKLVEPGKLIFWHDLLGVALFAACSALFETIDFGKFREPARPEFVHAILGLLYQGVVVAGFCFAAQAWLLRKHAASKVSVFSFATPLFGITLAVLFRGDQLSPWLLVSAAGVATGILLVNLPDVEGGRGDTERGDNERGRPAGEVRDNGVRR